MKLACETSEIFEAKDPPNKEVIQNLDDFLNFLVENQKNDMIYMEEIPTKTHKNPFFYNIGS